MHPIKLKDAFCFVYECRIVKGNEPFIPALD